MVDADIDTLLADKKSNVSPIRRRFSSTDIPEDLPLRRAVMDAVRDGIIHVAPAPLVSRVEYEQVSHLKELKQELGQYLDTASVAKSSLLPIVEKTANTALEFTEYVKGRCAVYGIKKQYGIALACVVLIELKYPAYLAGLATNTTYVSVVRHINDFGWMEPEQQLINDIHGFFVSKETGKIINHPLTDLRPESARFKATEAHFTSVAPLPPIPIAAVMRALRAGMDITIDGTPEHDEMAKALDVFVGLAVRRGATMLTLGWATNVHHNTIRKYAQRSPVAVYSLGIRGSKDQKPFEKRQKALISKKPVTDTDSDDEYISVVVEDSRNPVLLIETLAPVMQEFGTAVRPKLRLLKHKAHPDAKIDTVVIGSFDQYSSHGKMLWRTETMSSQRVRSMFPERDAAFKTNLGEDVISPQRKGSKNDKFSVCDLEVALISIAGIYNREGDPILDDGELKRMLLPVNPLANLAHLVSNNTVEDANKYCRDVEDYLKRNNTLDRDHELGQDDLEDLDDDTKQILVDLRATELQRYVPNKYFHYVDPNRFEEKSLIWKALCMPGLLVELTDSAKENPTEFDKTVPSLGVVDEGGQIRPPKKRKGGPYARK